MEDRVAQLASNDRLNEVQRGYPLQLEAAMAKGEDGTLTVLGVSRYLADCLTSVIREDAARAEGEKRLPDWTEAEVTERVVKPAVEAGLVLMRRIEVAAARGETYYKFQGGLDATTSMLSQTRRFERELLAEHAWPLSPGEESPLAAVEALYEKATPPLEEIARKVAEERKLRWASLGSGLRP
jgi:hypothetical protein